MGRELLDEMRNGVKPTNYNKTTADWVTKKLLSTVSNKDKTPKKSHFSTRASSTKPAFPLPKLCILDEEECAETKFFQAYYGKVQMIQPDPGKLTVKSILQAKALEDKDLEEYNKLKALGKDEAEKLELPVKVNLYQDDGPDAFWKETG